MMNGGDLTGQGERASWSVKHEEVAEELTALMNVSDEEFPERAAEFVASHFDGVAEVWFHGSRARGDHEADSDWDFVVVLDDAVEDDAFLDAVIAAGRLDDFEGRDVDVECQRFSHFYGPARSGANIGWWAREEGYRVWDVCPDPHPSTQP